MYVCLCHGFTEKQVTHAVTQGPCSISEVYRRLGERPACGKCIPQILQIARSETDSPLCCSAPA